MLTIPGWN